MIEIKELGEGVPSDGARAALLGVNATRKRPPGVCKELELEMNTLLRSSALAVAAAAAKYIAC